MKPTLVNQFGRPVQSRSGFFQGGAAPLRRENPFRFYNAAYDTKELLPTASWLQLLSSSRFLFANVPIVRGAILEQCLYSFPLEARYTGPDKEWGDLAETRLYEWRQNPTLRGWPFDGHMISRIRLIGYKVDGDVFTVLTNDQDGLPRVQIQRAHRVGTRYEIAQNDVIIKGPYKGKRICNGAIIDQWGRTVAYLILGDTIAEDQYVSSIGMFPTCRPDYSDEYRGISHLVASIRSFADHKRLREYELRAMAMQSAFVANNRTETGMPNPVNMAIESGEYPSLTSGNQSSPTFETLEDGLFNYVKSGTGSGLEFLRPDRPGENWQAFEERIVGAALYGTEWDPNFALMIKEPGGANARITLQKVNRCILMNASVEARTQRREDWYKLEWDIENGLLRPPSDRNTTAFTYKLALPQLTADSGNEENAKREAYKLGLSDLLTLATERGMDWEELRLQRRREMENLLTHVRDVQSQNPELTFTDVLNLFEQRTPNAAVVSVQTQSDQLTQQQTQSE